MDVVHMVSRSPLCHERSGPGKRNRPGSGKVVSTAGSIRERGTGAISFHTEKDGEGGSDNASAAPFRDDP